MKSKSNKGATTAALTLLITSGMLASALGIRQVNDENNVTAWVINKNMSAGQTVTVHDVEQKSIDPSNYSNIALSVQNPRALIGQKLATNKMVEQPLFDTDFIRAKSQKVSPSIIKNSISALSSRFPPTWRLHVQPMNKIVRPQITKYSLIRLGLISFCVFAFVYYFLRLPRRLHNEIKQKNQLILNREELFSSSLDALPHGFAIFNSHEFPVITNNAFNLLFAQVNKQNSQLSYSQLVSIAQQNNIINHYHEHHKLDDDRNQLIDIGFTDGKWITVLQRHTDFNGFVCYFRDDTEAHQKECLLADVLEKSKQTNQLKEKFVTRLSRQLKTPLSSLKSLVEISKDPISFNEFKNNVGNISDACDQLESVIQQLVNINKSEIGKLKLQAKNVNLNHMINNNISILTKEAEKKK